MKNKTIKFITFTAITLALGGCDFMQNNVGKYMPTIGEPCNNWQCFTSSGQAESDMNRRTREQGGSPARIPLNNQAPAQPGATAPATAPTSSSTPTPFDMTPEQLGQPAPQTGWADQGAQD